jgi:hypothetical protein
LSKNALIVAGIKSEKVFLVRALKEFRVSRMAALLSLTVGTRWTAVINMEKYVTLRLKKPVFF